VEVRGLQGHCDQGADPGAVRPAFEGEAGRGEDIYFEAGGNKAPTAVELVTMKDMQRSRTAGWTSSARPRHAPRRAAPRDGVVAEWRPHDAGRLRADPGAPDHHLVNFAKGVMHIGQRDIACTA